ARAVGIGAQPGTGLGIAGGLAHRARGRQDTQEQHGAHRFLQAEPGGSAKDVPGSSRGLVGVARRALHESRSRDRIGRTKSRPPRAHGGTEVAALGWAVSPDAPDAPRAHRGSPPARAQPETALWPNLKTKIR